MIRTPFSERKFKVKKLTVHQGTERVDDLVSKVLKAAKGVNKMRHRILGGASWENQAENFCCLLKIIDDLLRIKEG